MTALSLEAIKKSLLEDIVSKMQDSYKRYPGVKPEFIFDDIDAKQKSSNNYVYIGVVFREAENYTLGGGLQQQEIAIEVEIGTPEGTGGRLALQQLDMWNAIMEDGLGGGLFYYTGYSVVKQGEEDNNYIIDVEYNGFVFRQRVSK